MSDRLKLPPERDFGFYQRRKHDKWRAVAPPAPALEAPVADSHAHIHMLPDPAWELERCAANGVDFVCEICDPSEDDHAAIFAIGDSGECALRFAVGVHPHNAKLYSDAIEGVLLELLGDARVVALGEIGLDYHYDLSPRDVQRRVFERQIALAHELNLPIALHLRDGEDPQADNAHTQAFDILRNANALGPRTLLHCCSLPVDELQPWVDAGCYIAYGGALTFKNADAAREGARLVPLERLLVETDAPFMAPEPMRGVPCTPAHVIFTAAALADIRGIAPGDERRAFLQQLRDNTKRFYREREAE